MMCNEKLRLFCKAKSLAPDYWQTPPPPFPQKFIFELKKELYPVADPGGAREPCPPGPVKISHKKDGHRRRLHRFHVSRPLPYPVAGSATVANNRKYYNLPEKDIEIQGFPLTQNFLDTDVEIEVVGLRADYLTTVINDAGRSPRHVQNVQPERSVTAQVTAQLLNATQTLHVQLHFLMISQEC